MTHLHQLCVLLVFAHQLLELFTLEAFSMKPRGVSVLQVLEQNVWYSEVIQKLLGEGRNDRLINNMESENQTGVSEFLLLGLSEDPELQPLLFGLFLSMYLVTVLGNLLIILAVSSDSQLHTPMHFFLSHLSFVDICFTSTIVPKMLVNIQTGNKAITDAGCLTQVVMNALLHGLMVLHLSFCTDLKIPHFFCELAQILRLACSDTLINDILMYLVTSLLGVGPLSGIIFSYTRIVSSSLRIPSIGGK
eukprot:bmy_21844T0